MGRKNNKSYYALVWIDSLKSKLDLIIKGELIHKKTKLPKDPSILYGTNPNDVAKIRIVEAFEEIKYDVYTMEQSVKFWSESDEYIVPRDVRIVVWEGKDELNLPYDKYRIVSPELFELIVATSGERQSSKNDDNTSINWEIYKNSINNIKDNVLNELEFNINDYVDSTIEDNRFIILKKNINNLYQ